jgi:hypothetical protein
MTEAQTNQTIVERTRGAAHAAVDTTRSTASDAAHRAADGIDANPIAALVGGIALGVAVGALLPRTERERETLGPLGKRLTDSAAAAARAARDAGKQEVEALIPDKAGAKEKASALLGSVAKAARDGAKTA